MNVIRQFWQEKLSAVFTEMSFVSFGRKRSSEKLVYLCHRILVVGEQRTWGAFSTPFLLLKILIFVTMKKNYIYYALGVAVVVGAYLILKSLKPKKPAPNGTTSKQQAFGDSLPTIPQYIIDEGFAKQNARLQEKRALYEAQWKKSGSELSFKDWYIENAT